MQFVHSKTYSQLAITESAFSCSLNNIAASPIGQLNLNAKTLNLMFEKSYIKFDTTSLREYLPIFHQKLGGGQELKMDLHFKNIKTMFGQYNTDMILEYTACFSIYPDNRSERRSERELIYDEIPMITSMDVRSKNDVLYINMINNKIDYTQDFGMKKKPVRNTMEMTSVEYNEFLADFSHSMNYFKNWLNQKHFVSGIYFPYNTDEFDTHLNFMEKSMHIMMEVEDRAYIFFDDEFI